MAQKTYNVIAPVIALVNATDAKSAQMRLNKALEKAGFVVYDGDVGPLAERAFPSEVSVSIDDIDKAAALTYR